LKKSYTAQMLKLRVKRL